MTIEKYSMGIGDRFGHQGIAQLSALAKAEAEGFKVIPVWNKSKREHLLIGSSPIDARIEADNAVKALDWSNPYYVDADHINLNNVDIFVPYCDFYTIDVADYINLPYSENDYNLFIKKASEFTGTLSIPNLSHSYSITEEKIKSIAVKYLSAIKEAVKIYNHIRETKRNDNFVTEVSLDENEQPQTPEELFFILMGLAMENIPVQTIAPKFTGRFNKGVDYIGNIDQFTQEFEDDIVVIKYAVELFKLPSNLKLSVHSGSDKFSLYKHIHRITKKYNSGVHVKTAGTTWLEELIGLAEAEGEGLEIAKEIYTQSYKRIDEMMKPYLSVVDIKVSQLPLPEEVDMWSGEDFANTLRHDQSHSKFNIHFRQLLHLGYKVAAEMGKKYINALEKYENVIAKNVTTNIYERHIKPLFIGDEIKQSSNVELNNVVK